jgi:hypothetical protein
MRSGLHVSLFEDALDPRSPLIYPTTPRRTAVNPAAFPQRPWPCELCAHGQWRVAAAVGGSGLLLRYASRQCIHDPNHSRWHLPFVRPPLVYPCRPVRAKQTCHVLVTSGSRRPRPFSPSRSRGGACLSLRSDVGRLPLLRGLVEKLVDEYVCEAPPRRVSVEGARHVPERERGGEREVVCARR